MPFGVADRTARMVRLRCMCLKLWKHSRQRLIQAKPYLSRQRWSGLPHSKNLWLITRLPINPEEETMKEALIVWGGWSGHEPQEWSGIVTDIPAEEGSTVYVEKSTEASADPSL